MSFDFNASDYKIFGDSNVYTIARAVVRSRGELKASGFPLSLVRPLASANEFYSPFYSVVEGQMVITDPKIRERLAGSVCDSEGRVFKPNGSVWFFSGGFHTLTFLNSKRWDTHRHWRVTHKPILPPVSDAVFAAMVLDINGEFLNFLRDATSLGHRVAVLSSPPPTERFVTRMAAKEWSAEDILFMDRAFRDVMIKRLEEMGVPLVLPPDDVTEGGFLKPEFLVAKSQDTHHGNIKYSQEVIRNLAQICGYPIEK